MNLSTLHQVCKSKIIERRDMAHADQEATVEGFARRHARRNWGLTALDWTTTGTPVLAFVNAGRWHGSCPDCMGDEKLNLDEPVFWCASCANVANEHRPRPVIFPETTFRRQVEALLLERPGPTLPGGPSTRNWHPGETLADLERENVAHGHRASPPVGKAR